MKTEKPLKKSEMDVLIECAYYFRDEVTHDGFTPGLKRESAKYKLISRAIENLVIQNVR